MKTTFILNALVASALPQVTDKAKLTQACEANLNSFKVKSADAERDGVKVYKGGTSEFDEHEHTTYIGQTDIVSQFLSWHDKVDKLATDTQKKAERLSCVARFQVAEIPPRFADWIAKFNTDAVAKPAADKPATTPKANGKPAVAPVTA